MSQITEEQKVLKQDEARLQKYSKDTIKVHSSLCKKVNRAIDTSTVELNRLKQENNAPDMNGSLVIGDNLLGQIDIGEKGIRQGGNQKIRRWLLGEKKQITLRDQLKDYMTNKFQKQKVSLNKLMS